MVNALIGIAEYNLLAKGAIGQFPGTSTVLYSSPLGTPVFSDLAVEADSYILDGQTFNFTDIDEMSALFVVDQKKIIKRTAINNRNGRVKEFIGMDDFEISCAIKMIGTNLRYPQEAVNNIITALQSNQSLHVRSWFLNQFNIYDIVVQDFSFPQTTGNIGEQIISFTAFSDKPLILQQL